MLVLELRPRDAGSVQQLYALVQAYPLIALGHSGSVACLGCSLARDGIDQGGLAHIRDARDHGSHGSVQYAAFSVTLALLSQRSVHRRRQLLYIRAAARIRGDALPALCDKILSPCGIGGGLCHIRLVHDDDPSLAAPQCIDIRVPCRERSTRVHHLYDQIHDLHILLHIADRLGHMPRIPLYLHISTPVFDLSVRRV